MALLGPKRVVAASREQVLADLLLVLECFGAVFLDDRPPLPTSVSMAELLLHLGEAGIDVLLVRLEDCLAPAGILGVLVSGVEDVCELGRVRLVLVLAGAVGRLDEHDVVGDLLVDPDILGPQG